MVAFIDTPRGEYGVEPIGRKLPIDPLQYYAPNAHETEPARDALVRAAACMAK